MNRRVRAANATATRRFVVGPAPGTDLEVLHMVTDDAGIPISIFVYHGYRPILKLKFVAGVPVVDCHYLEDAMGSVIALGKPDGTVVNAFRYDAFGNVIRSWVGSSTTGTPDPTPSANTPLVASGSAAGDFRFHGAWLETGSKMYHLRARDYDPVIGRFLSRDPYDGDIRQPESMNPYVFANSNPMVYSDPIGAFSILELDVVTAKQFSLQTFKGAASAYARKKAREEITSFASQSAGKAISTFLGFDPRGIVQSLAEGADPLKGARSFESKASDLLCSALRGVEGFAEQVHTGVRVSSAVSPRGPIGTPLTRGRRCGGAPNLPESTGWSTGIEYGIPDFIIGEQPILDSVPPHRFGEAFTVGDFKLSLSALYNAYASPAPQRSEQFRAIIGYARQHTYSKTALFIVGHNRDLGIGGMKASAHQRSQIKAVMSRALAKEGVIPAVVTLLD